MDDLSFGNWLKRRRRGLGLTQNELARRAGYSGETLRKVEADALRPSRQMAELLADQLAIAPDERAAFVRFARDEPESDAPLLPLPIGLPHRHSTLPIQPNQLIGREKEAAALRQFLLSEGVRVLSLLGPPGVGKTRLALHTAALLEEEFTDGVCFVALAPLNEPALVAGELAQALGVREAGAQPVIDRLKSYLRDRRMLLVLDNFEHLLAAAAVVAELLAACPGVKVLVTSRAALHLAGELEYEVPALALPSLNPLPPLDSLASCAAVALYVQRTQAIQPTFHLTQANAPAVAEVCVHLDGLPLAIELAAARGKLFSPAALLARLAEHERLALLISDARDRPARQQSLRATIDWSYNLLHPATRTMFARLGVFAGGCTLDAAEAVCGDSPATAATEASPHGALLSDRLQLDGLLGSLIDQSLVRRTEGLEGEPRFWMLETLREYALERLADSGDVETLRRRHAAYYLTLAENANIETRGADQVRWLDRLAADHDNFRAALTWSLTVADGAEIGLRLANGLGKFWEGRSYYMEGQKWFTEVLQRTQDIASLQRVEVLSMASRLMWMKYDYRRQEGLAQEAVNLARQLGGQRHLSQALSRLGHALAERGDFVAARAVEQEGLVLARTAGDIQVEAQALRMLGLTARMQCDFAVAAQFGEQALALAFKCGDRSLEAFIRYDLGMTDWLPGRHARAVAHFHRSDQMFQELGNKHLLGVVQWCLGSVALDQNDLALASRHLRRCLASFREADFPVGFCGYLLGMAGIATARGQATAAVRLTGAAHALRAALGHQLEPGLVPRYERQLARACAQLDEDTVAAAWAAGQALSVEKAITEALAQEVARLEQA